MLLGAGCASTAVESVVGPEGEPVELVVGRTDAPYETVVAAAKAVLEEETGSIQRVWDEKYRDGLRRTTTIKSGRVVLGPFGQYREFWCHVKSGFPSGAVYLEVWRNERVLLPFGQSFEYPFLVLPLPFYAYPSGTTPADVVLISRILGRTGDHSWIPMNRMKTELP
jgi:hypothetical protein